MTRLSVLASHSERVFSWTHEMKRLDWKLFPTNTLTAIHDGWGYTITQKQGNDLWQLSVGPIQDRGPDWRKWFTTTYLQDAMAIAEALGAGEDLG